MSTVFMVKETPYMRNEHGRPSQWWSSIWGMPFKTIEKAREEIENRHRHLIASGDDKDIKYSQWTLNWSNEIFAVQQGLEDWQRHDFEIFEAKVIE